MRTSEEYTEDYGYTCPICHRGDLSTPKVPQIHGTEIRHSVTCLDCLSTWEDIYKLAGYHNLKETTK